MPLVEYIHKASDATICKYSAQHHKSSVPVPEKSEQYEQVECLLHGYKDGLLLDVYLTQNHAASI